MLVSPAIVLFKFYLDYGSFVMELSIIL